MGLPATLLLALRAGIGVHVGTEEYCGKAQREILESLHGQ